jgi:hypothetical protein
MTGTISVKHSQYLVRSLAYDLAANVLLTIKSGRRTPIAEIPTPDFAVPYAAPKHVNTIAEVQPMAPKNGYRWR